MSANPPLLDYVLAAAALQGIVVDLTRAQAVAVHLERTANMAELLTGATLAVDLEPAELYRPAAFPEADPADGEQAA